MDSSLIDSVVCIKESNCMIFVWDVLKIVLSGLVTLFIAWRIWKSQKNHDLEKERLKRAEDKQKAQQKYVHLLTVLADDLKVGIRDQIAISASAYNNAPINIRHRLIIPKRIDKILDLAEFNDNTKLLANVQLCDDHFKFINDLLDLLQGYELSLITQRNSVSAGFNSINDRNGIVEHVGNKLKHLLNVYNQIVKEINRNEHQHIELLTEMEFQNMFNEIINNHPVDLFVPTGKSLQYFNELMQFQFTKPSLKTGKRD